MDDNRRERDPRQEDRRWPVRTRFNSFGKTQDHLHDRELDRLYNIFRYQQRQLGNVVRIHKDEMQVHSELNRDLYWTRKARQAQTGNSRYKLSIDEREEIARKHNLTVAGGHITIPDRQVVVRTPDGRESIVALEALTRSYSRKQIERHVKSGAVTSMAEYKPAWKVCAERMGFKRVRDGPDLIGRLMRSVK